MKYYDIIIIKLLRVVMMILIIIKHYPCLQLYECPFYIFFFFHR